MNIVNVEKKHGSKQNSASNVGDKKKMMDKQLIRRLSQIGNADKNSIQNNAYDLLTVLTKEDLEKFLQNEGVTKSN